MKSFKTPILFITFKRLDTTKQVLEQILKVRPEKFYVFSDGPRNEDEAKDVYRVREYITNECKKSGIEFKSLFMDRNYGANNCIYASVDMVLSKENCLISIEDDILPSISLFYFMEKMLNIYNDEHKIWSVLGAGFSYENNENNIYFSKLHGTWAVGMWKSRWDDLKNEYNKILEKQIYSSSIYRELGYIDYRYSKFFDAWYNLPINKFPIDARFMFYALINKKLSIRPTKKLIKNLDWFGGVHGSEDGLIGELPKEDLEEIDINSIKYKKPKHDLERDRKTIEIMKSFDLFHGITRDTNAISLRKILANHENISIYGAGAMGVVFYKVWDDVFDGNVCCFLDDNATGFVDDIPILKPENNDIKPDAVIISIVNKVAAKSMEDKIKKYFPNAKVYNIRDIVMGNV